MTERSEKDQFIPRFDPDGRLGLDFHAARALLRFRHLQGSLERQRAAILSRDTQFREGDVMRARLLEFIDQIEGIEEKEHDARCTRIKIQYEHLPANSKKRCPWKEVKNRLLANNGHYLALVENMDQGGIMFGVDYEGNPLFADKGLVMPGMNYPDTRKAVLYRMEGDKEVETGYEMFPYKGRHEKSPEINMYEATTGEPIVESDRSIWLESGSDVAWPRRVIFLARKNLTKVSSSAISAPRRSSYGVRRLLRIKK